MKKLIKTICGGACEIYAIIHHDRISVGKAVPEVEVYENNVEAPTLGGGIRCKSSFFSIIICPNPEMSAGIMREVPQGLTAFDLAMTLPRKDTVLVPFTVYGVSDADLSPDRWEFRITDPETLKKLLSL